ncbi:helix-turn-helix domain-containing protein [Enterococcus sp. DIV0187]|uniref:helix-turn-helix domain-containing protein n=1 Tax=Enterococcus sp. DIV0187 TaxID=2774644 RepID=UPI003F686796
MDDPEIQELILDLTDSCQCRGVVVIPLKATREMRQKTSLLFTYFIQEIGNYTVDEVIAKLVDQMIQANEDVLYRNHSYVTLIRFMEEQVDKQLTRKDFCLLLHMSPTALQQMCLKYAGMSAMRLFAKVKYREAERLLIETSLSIKEISEKLGFKNSKHFSTYFRKQKGKTPSQVRKERGASIYERR